MQNLVRLGIATLTGTVGIGGAAIVVSSLATADDPAPAKREDTATTWVVDSNDDGKDTDDDGLTGNTGPSTLSQASVNPAPKANSASKAQVNSNSGNAAQAPKAQPKPKAQVNSNSGGGNSNSGGGNSNS